MRHDLLSYRVPRVLVIAVCEVASAELSIHREPGTPALITWRSPETDFQRINAIAINDTPLSDGKSYADPIPIGIGVEESCAGQ